MLAHQYKGMVKINYQIPDYNIDDVADPQKRCSLCGHFLDHKDEIKNYKPVDIIKKICELSTHYPQSMRTLALTISHPGLTFREYAEMLGISKMAVSLNLKRLEQEFGVKLYCPKMKNATGQRRRRKNEKK